MSTVSGKEVLEKAQRYQKEKESLIEKAQVSVRKLHTISCDACSHSHCCLQLAVVYLFEGVMIVNELGRSGQFRKWKELVDDGKQQRELINDCGWEKGAEKWFEMRKMCPLIDDKGLCSVYRIRPTVCSTCWVTSPSAMCAPPKGGVLGIDNAEILSMGALHNAAFIEEIGQDPRLALSPLLLGEAVRFGLKLLAGDLLPVEFQEVVNG